MAVIVPVGYGQARFLFQLSGRPSPYVVTFGILAPGDFPDTIASNIRGFFTAASRPFVAANMSNFYTFLGVDVTQMTANGPMLGSALTPIVGTNSVPPVPPNAAMLFRKNTTRGGRKGRGRLFLPPVHMDEGVVDHLGNINSSTVTNVNTWWSAAMTAWVASTYPPMLLHEDGSAPNPITSVSLQSQLATQRRRLR